MLDDEDHLCPVCRQNLKRIPCRVCGVSCCCAGCAGRGPVLCAGCQAKTRRIEVLLGAKMQETPPANPLAAPYRRVRGPVDLLALSGDNLLEPGPSNVFKMDSLILDRLPLNIRPWKHLDLDVGPSNRLFAHWLLFLLAGWTADPVSACCQEHAVYHHPEYYETFWPLFDGLPPPWNRRIAVVDVAVWPRIESYLVTSTNFSLQHKFLHFNAWQEVSLPSSPAGAGCVTASFLAIASNYFTAGAIPGALGPPFRPAPVIREDSAKPEVVEYANSFFKSVG
jgi:hypothetical protein